MNDYENKIIAEIQALKENELTTQELYREVCTIMFFRYGVTPTANKLYQLVKKGSMSAPAEALSKFWADLREKSRVRIEHPDLPEGLKTAAGDLVALLWSQAQARAEENMSALKEEVSLAVKNSQEICEAANRERNNAKAELLRV